MAFAHVLREDGQRLLVQCTNIALTEDTRAGYEVVRARLTMGRGLPAGMSPQRLLERRPIPAGCRQRRTAEATFTAQSPSSMAARVSTSSLLTLRKLAAYATTVYKAAGIVDALRDLAGGVLGAGSP